MRCRRDVAVLLQHVTEYILDASLCLQVWGCLAVTCLRLAPPKLGEADVAYGEASKLQARPTEIVSPAFQQRRVDAASDVRADRARSHSYRKQHVRRARAHGLSD